MDDRIEWLAVAALVICVLTLFVATTTMFVGGVLDYRPVLVHSKTIGVAAVVSTGLIPFLLIFISFRMGRRSLKIWLYTFVCLIPSAPFFGFACYVFGLSCRLP